MSSNELSIALASYRSHPASGGQGVYVSNLSRELARMGHRVDVLSGRPYPDIPDDVNLIKIPGPRFSRSNSPPFVLPDRLRSLSDWGEWLGRVIGAYPEPWAFGRRLARYLRERTGKYDIVHDNQGLAYGLLDLQRSGLPVVASIHHPVTIDRDIALHRTENRLTRWQIRLRYRFTAMQKKVAPELSGLITGSRRARDDLIREYEVDGRDIEVIPYGVNMNLFRPLEDVERNARYLLAVSSAQWMRQIKGFGTLLESFRQLVRDRPELNLIVVGTPDSEGRTEVYLMDMDIADRVAFVQKLDTGQLVRLYNRAAMLIVPSIYEGFGFPAAEAMACGTPVVSTTAGGLPEVVGDAAALVPPEDPSRLADKVSELLNNPSLRETLGRRGRERALEKFQWPATARRTVDVYRKVLRSLPR